MNYKQSSKIKINPWGDDHPEKTPQTQKGPSAVQQLAGLVNPTKMIDQIFGTPQAERQHFPKYKERATQTPRENLVFSYKNRKEDTEMKKETGLILNEIKKQITLLEKSEKALSKQVAKFKIEKVPPKAGIYYLRYFEWLLGLIKQLRMRVDEGRTWLAAFSQMKKKKLGYWKMYKKHGTTFGLSHERNLATQTG